MIITILLIIILVVVCLSYNHQLRKDKLKKNKNIIYVFRNNSSYI